MLKELSVDTENFNTIFSKMRKEISDIYPKWNDYNYHDPGITLLELFAFLIENQNYLMDRTSDNIYMNFLKLAFRLPEKAKPAHLHINVNHTKKINKYDKFFVLQENDENRNIVFEATENVTLCDNLIKEFRISNEVYNQNFYPFTEQPAYDCVFFVVLNEPLNIDNTYILWVDVKEAEKRNPITKDFIPLANMKIYYNDTELEFIDTTFCFLQSGEIKFKLPEKYKDNYIDKFELKFELISCDYDISPFIYEMSFSHIKLIQRDTKVVFDNVSILNNISVYNKTISYLSFDENTGFFEFCNHYEDNQFVCVSENDENLNTLIGVGKGMPNQYYTIKGDFIYSIGILVENTINKDKFEKYEQVFDFESSTPISKHFILKGNNIIFGNGIRGRCPEGRILISELVFTKGEQGNISKDNTVTIDDIEIPMYSDSFLGKDPETIEDVLNVVENEIPTRLVTASDFEKAISKTTGLIIDDCKTLDSTTSNDEVAIVVKPYGVRTFLSQKYKDNIMLFLEPRRLICSKIKIYSPTYTEVGIFIDVVRNPLYLDVKNEIQKKLNDYFENLKTFGAITEYSVLYQKIDGMDEIIKINSFTISARGEGVVRNRKGDIITLPNSVTYLKDTEILLNTML